MSNEVTERSFSHKKPLVFSPFFVTKRSALVLFIFFVLFFFFIALFYFLNLVRWSREADFGWSIALQTDRKVLVEVYGAAKDAGLRAGDTIIGVNGARCNTYFQFQKSLNRASGDQNMYEVERDGRIIMLTVPNSVLGFGKAFTKFGFTMLLGTLFFILGAVVFFMKPATPPSWAFLIMMFNAGIYIMFTFVSKLSPEWLGSVFLFSAAFLPAAVLHLAQTFPEERTWRKNSYLPLAIPYVFSFLLFITMRFYAPIFMDVPVFLKQLTTIYLALSLFAFLASTVSTFLRATSIARIRSKVILTGAAIAISVPLVDVLTFMFLNLTLVPHPALNLPFYVFFPLSIAYAIAKHNLFDVDVYIKRAVGYGIMTAIVGLTYFSLQVGVRTAFEPVFGEHSEKIYPILFAVLVVFLFNPLNRTVQTAVDKLFYRKKFDYKDTVTKVSNALTSMLDLNEVIRKLINTARLEMFIDRAGVLILDDRKKECQTMFIGDENEEVKPNENECIQYDDPFINVLTKNKKLVTVYDINEDPHYRDIRETCSERFQRMGVSMVLPLVYQGEVKGALALGYKKSGHFYTREDIDLLSTLANSGAVAIENAKLVDQIKKEEIIRTNLSRYLSPQVVEDIIHKDVEVNLGGDRKTVTILFMDLIGFTSLSEKLQPEEVVSILNEYFTEMSKGIFKWQGTLDKFAGDQIMAFWGAPFPQPNHAELAVQCALDVSRRLDGLQKKWGEEGKPVLNCGIGINTGEVLVGNIGVEGMKMDYTVIGDTVNLAARVEKITRQYESRILITEFTYEHIRKSIESGMMSGVKFTDLAEVKVKGKEQGVRIYRVEGKG